MLILGKGLNSDQEYLMQLYQYLQFNGYVLQLRRPIILIED